MAAGIYQKQRLNLDIIGLVSSIADATLAIDSGRKGFAIISNAKVAAVAWTMGIATTKQNRNV
jgi:hypothetical protein